MTGKDVLRQQLIFVRGVTKALLADLTDADLLVRPVPAANHIAWQLGHLIHSEQRLLNAICPGKASALPDGFASKHGRENSASDNPADFLSKDRYLELFQEQRDASLKALDAVTDADLIQPAPPGVPGFAKTVTDVFLLIGNHELMHLGQFSAVRRKLGKPHVI